MTDAWLARLRRLREERLAHWLSSAAGPWSLVDPRIPTMAIARAIDCAQYRGWRLTHTLRTSGGITSDVSGWDSALAPFEAALASMYGSPGAPLFPSNVEVEKWADSALHVCSTVHLLDRAMALVQLGWRDAIGSPAQNPEPVEPGEGAEEGDLAIDTELLFADAGHRDDVISIRHLVRETQHDALSALAKERAKVLALMRARTSPWQTHFPSYGSSPAIDSWYLRLGELLTSRMLAFSCVPHDVAFGGIHYRLFVEVIADQIMFALKHLDFCVLLQESHPDLRWSNLLTIWQDVAAVRTTARERHELDVSAAETVIRTLTWEAGRIEWPDGSGSLSPTTRLGPAAPLPLFLRISENQHLFLLSGVLGEPLRYLNHRLREAYPEDWAAARPAMTRELAARVAGILPTEVFRVPPIDDAPLPVTFLSADGQLAIVPQVDTLAPDTSRPPHGRMIIRVVADPGTPAIWEPQGKLTNETVLSMERFARTALKARPVQSLQNRLRQEAIRSREQLRLERLPTVLQVGRRPRSITMWTPSILDPVMPVSTDASDPRHAVECMESAIAAEERVLLGLARGIDRRYLMVLLTSAADQRMSFSAALRNGGRSDDPQSEPADRMVSRDEDSDSQLEATSDSIFWFGLPRLLGMFAGADTDRPWPPDEQPPVHSELWADTAARRAGEIAALAQAIGMVKTGLATVSRDSDRSWTVRLKPGPRGIELRERDHILALTERLRRMRRDLVERLEREQHGLAKRLSRYIKLTHEHELSISTPPRVYKHFLEAVLHSADQMIGPDAFPGDAALGKLPFGMYRLITLALSAEALLRITASDTLSGQDALFDPRVIRTTGWRLPVLARRLGDLIGISETDAREAIEPLVLGHESAAAFHESARPALPPLVRTAPDHVLMSTWGCLDEPFQFLLFRLRQLHPSDWDRAVDSREGVFRSDVYDALVSDPSGRFQTSATGVKIREAGRVLTDIDAIIYDRVTGDLALFQLKWQDPFGASLSKRASAAKNFSTGASEWVRVVSHWLSLMNSKQVCARLGIRTAGDAPPRPLLFVLGRYASHFSDYGPPDPRAAWGTWPQVLNLVARTRQEPSLLGAAQRAPIGWLDNELRTGSPFAEPAASVETEEWIAVGGIHVRVTTAAN